MADYQYTGTGSSGEKTSGTLTATDRKTAIRILQQRGIVPIRIAEHSGELREKSSESGAKSSPGSVKFARPRWFLWTPQTGNLKGSHTYGLKFAKRLLELHSGGMPLGDSIFLLSQRLSEVRLKNITTEVWHQLREGKSFAKAVETIPNLFPSAMIPLFEAGDASGDMVAILKNTIEYIEDRKGLTRRILASISYPFLLVFMVMLIMVLFLKFLVPMIQGLIESMGGEMNIFTRIMIGISQWIISASPIALVLAVVGTILWVQWRRTEKGRITTDRWLLRIPLLGKIIELSGQYQLSNLMCTLMESGINTSDNLRLCERTIQNHSMKVKFATARAMIIEGASFSAAFKQNALYPESAIDILTVGENTGKLERGLREITNSVRSMLDSRLKTLTILVSAGAMAFAFLMVAFAAIGMVLSVLEVSQTINL